MANVSYMNYSTETYWVRDYGPWFIAYGDEEIGVVNFKYNRNRPTDDEIPMHYAEASDLEWFGMNVTHTGGNFMSDGYSQGVNTDLIIDENTQSLEEMNEKFASYLGITNMHTTEDPLGDYIKHVDCWGKYLDVDKILISRVPESHGQYDEYEAVATYFENTISSYGTPLQVFRADIPGNNQITPFTNSLILNGKVFVPITGTTYDAAALEVYETAMPGYEIIPISPGPQGWLNTDALHCRAHEIADDEMLYIAHQPVISAEVNAPIEINAAYIAYSDAELVSSELNLFYQINGGDFTEVAMTQVDGNNYSAAIPAQIALTEIGYYIHGEDQAGKIANHPYIGSADPHTFLVGRPIMAVSTNNIELTIAPGNSEDTTFQISNIGELDVNYQISYTAAAAERETYEYNISDSPASGAYESNTYDENNWEDFEVTENDLINTVEISYDWATDNYASEGSFKIESPAGITATIGAGQASGNYTSTLNNFNHEIMDGDWKIWIADSYGDGGHQATNITVSFNTLAASEIWLEVTPIIGTIIGGDSTDITISADAANLEMGDYIGSINISSNDPETPTAHIDVNLTVGNVDADDTELQLSQLYKNYPNPFNPETTISFSVNNSSAKTDIAIYNMKGQKIKQLVNDKMSAGIHSVVWTGTDNNNKKAASGVYFYKMTNGNFSASKKMILMK